MALLKEGQNTLSFLGDVVKDELLLGTDVAPPVRSRTVSPAHASALVRPFVRSLALSVSHSFAANCMSHRKWCDRLQFTARSPSTCLQVRSSPVLHARYAAGRAFFSADVSRLFAHALYTPGVFDIFAGLLMPPVRGPVRPHSAPFRPSRSHLPFARF